MVKDDYEDDTTFSGAANDITSQLEINFGNLPRPGVEPGGAAEEARKDQKGRKLRTQSRSGGKCVYSKSGWFSEVRG